MIGFPFIFVAGFYLYMAVLSGSFHEYVAWSGLILGLGTALGALMTSLDVLFGYLFSRL